MLADQNFWKILLDVLSFYATFSGGVVLLIWAYLAVRQALRIGWRRIQKAARQ